MVSASPPRFVEWLTPVLFKAVIGPELKVIFEYIVRHSVAGQRVTRDALKSAFLAYRPTGPLPTDSGLNQAVTFLTNVRMLQADGQYLEPQPTGQATFELELLRHLRARQLGWEKSEDTVDGLYLGLIDEL